MSSMVFLNPEIASATMLFMPKRSIQVGVRVSDVDLRLIQKAAETLWPGMPITNSTLLMTLAKQRAEEILAKTPRKRG